MIKKERVIAGFCQGSKTYEQAAGMQAQVALELFERIPHFPVNSILEIGSGTGLLSRYLLQRFSDRPLFLMDIAPSMLDQSRQKFGRKQNIHYLCADAESYQPSQPFDLIVSSMTVHWFEQPYVALNKITSFLKENGRFVFSLLGRESLSEWKAICLEYNVPIATPSFPEIDFLRKQLPQFHFESKKIKQCYDSVQHFLEWCKLLGATASPIDYKPMSADKLRRIMRSFSNKIKMTYEIIWGDYCKS